ncbi:MAG: hypothetical protein PUB15_02475 [Ruminobacter sp.]|nr:hypothetical protein [Ruminobacter sp.]MDY5780125.1 hypothetical protein [Succinivibrionaceae bacterium]
MANKVLIIPNYTGQDLPNEGLERFDQVYLITEHEDSIPLSVVKQLLKVTAKTGANIDFMEIPATSEAELLVALSFEVCNQCLKNPDIQITFLTDNVGIDHIINVAKKNGFKVSRADAFTKMSSIPTSQEAPKVATPKPTSVMQPAKPKEIEIAPKVSEVVQPAQTSSPAQEESAGSKNKRLISSLLNNSK